MNLKQGLLLDHRHLRHGRKVPISRDPSHIISSKQCCDDNREDAKCIKSSTRQWTMPTRLTLKNSGALGCLPFYAYWGTSGGPKSSPISHPPTYPVDTKQPHSGERWWMAKFSQWKCILCLRRTLHCFCNFHSAGPYTAIIIITKKTILYST